VIIDPIMAILGGKDTYKDNEVRSFLAPLKALAERTGVCIAMIRHVTKGNSDKLIYQGGGSIAFIGLSRVGLMFSKNPDDDEQYILTVAKSNLCLKPPKLLYRIVSDVGSDDERPYIRWEGVTTITDQELSRKPPQDNQGDKRNTILKHLKGAYPGALTPQQVADALDIDVNTANVTLYRMFQTDQVAKEGRGRYVAHSGLSY
jgi:AAA domain